MAISAFEERKFLTWGDKLMEFEEKFNKLDKFNDIRSRKDKSSEQIHINKLIEKGNEYQEQLNEEWLDYGYMTYKQYMTQMHRYIALQDIIINDIEKYIENCEKFYSEV